MSLFRVSPSAIPELALARQRRWRWVIGILCMIALGMVIARPFYREGKRWRAHSLVRQAEQLMAESQWQAAATKAYSAFQLAPDSPETLRALARLYTRTGLPLALGYWKALVSRPDVQTSDREEAAAFALATRQTDFAAEQMTQLLESAPESPKVLELAVQWAVQRNDRADALRLLDGLLRAQPGHSKAALWRGQLLFSSPDRAEHAAGQRLLQEIGEKTDAEALAALATLAGDATLTADDLERLAKKLESHPLAGTEQRLGAADLRLRAEPTRRTALLDQVVTELRAGPREARVLLGRWLLKNHEVDRVLDLLSEAETMADQELFLLRTDALAAAGKWADIRTMLEHKDVPLEALHRTIFLARACLELHDEPGAEAHWSQAFALAGKTPEKLFYLAQYTSRMGDTVRAEKAWRQLTRYPRYALAAWLAILPIVEAQGNTPVVRDTIRQIARLNPSDPAPRNDMAYLDLLLRENIVSAKIAAEQLVHEHPHHLTYRTTLALAHLRAGHPQAAAAVYAGLEINWDKASASARAVRLATLRANGGNDEALSQSLAEAPLKPEERALLSSTVSGFRPPSSPAE